MLSSRTAVVFLLGVHSLAGSLAFAASPLLKVGSLATPSGILGPGYGLFTCQVGSGPYCYDPYQIRHAYRIDSLVQAGYDGRGQTIVIVDAYQASNIVQQLNFYDTFYGLPGLNGLGGAPDPNLGTFTQVAPDGLTPFNSSDPNMVGWAEEISLDVLWAHAVAPRKTNDDADLLSVTWYAVDHRLGDVISQSFGGNESCMDSTLLAQQHQLFADATLKNITLIASAGDDGAAQLTCDGTGYVKAVSSPASDPLVTSVGGTELHAAPYCGTFLTPCDPPPGTYDRETVWNESDLGAATGGGFSVLFDAPSYQRGVIKGIRQRGVPDVSYNGAILYGVLTYLNIPGLPVGMYRFGGTSAGSPQWAALVAITNQKAGYPLGFINKALYHLGKTDDSSFFFDVTIGDNSLFGIVGYSAGPGWDPTTGLGSPKADQLVDNLIQRSHRAMAFRP